MCYNCTHTGEDFPRAATVLPVQASGPKKKGIVNMSIVETLKTPVPATLPEGKDRTTYLLLAFFLGTYGVHNFYAGYTDKAKIQLILGITCCCSVVSFITAIHDIVTVLGGKK